MSLPTESLVFVVTEADIPAEDRETLRLAKHLWLLAEQGEVLPMQQVFDRLVKEYEPEAVMSILASALHAVASTRADLRAAITPSEHLSA